MAKPFGFNKLALLFSSLCAFHVCFISTPALSAELTIGNQTAPISIDPHYTTSPGTKQVLRPVYEALFFLDENLVPQPALAESWKNTDDVTWIINLRKGVKFHDGSDFTAEDVLFSYKRVREMTNAASSHRSYLIDVKTIESVDLHTLKITTAAPSPTLFANLAYVEVVSRKHVAGPNATEDFNSGKAAIGTGPYKFVSWVQNDRTVLEKNPNYWGRVEPWDKVTIRVMSNDAARTAALMAGDVDIMSDVVPESLERLKANPNLVVWVYPTARQVYYALNATPTGLKGGAITGPNGEMLDKNPLEDKRIRQAMRLAIDLNGFATRIYHGQGEAFGQFVAKGALGHNEAVKPWTADVAAARKLVEESGWAGKFKIELAAAGNQFQGAVAVGEGLAQSWSRVGIPTTVKTMPYQTYLAQRNAFEIPISLAFASNPLGSVDRFMQAYVVTRDTKKGLGPNNYSNYSNPKVDAIYEQATQILDEKKRQTLFSEAMQVIGDDAATVSLWFVKGATASKKAIAFKGRLDGIILPMNVRPAAP